MDARVAVPIGDIQRSVGRDRDVGRAVERPAAVLRCRLVRDAEGEQDRAVQRALADRMVAVVREVNRIVGPHRHRVRPAEHPVAPRPHVAPIALEDREGMLAAAEDVHAVAPVDADAGDFLERPSVGQPRPILDEFKDVVAAADGDHPCTPVLPRRSPDIRRRALRSREHGGRGRRPRVTSRRGRFGTSGARGDGRARAAAAHGRARRRVVGVRDRQRAADRRRPVLHRPARGLRRRLRRGRRPPLRVPPRVRAGSGADGARRRQSAHAAGHRGRACADGGHVRTVRADARLLARDAVALSHGDQRRRAVLVDREAAVGRGAEPGDRDGCAAVRRRRRDDRRSAGAAPDRDRRRRAFRISGADGRATRPSCATRPCALPAAAERRTAARVDAPAGRRHRARPDVSLRSRRVPRWCCSASTASPRGSRPTSRPSSASPAPPRAASRR